MMGKIEVLDLHVANLIAAGEVVERPASCVKELLENALDAEATEITVEIKRGGVAFLRVADNGCGIAKEDLPVAIKRHATSKIRTAADLDGIMTLGFRGEALAAISSVSMLRIMTKRAEDRYGSLMVAEYGKVSDIAEIGCKNGTTVIVENLFANTPARRKFLKRDASEALAVTGMVEKIAISRPDIAFKMIVDGVVKFATPGDNRLYSAIYATLGKDFAERLIKVRSLTDGIEVIGYISRPESVRGNRGGQNFFVNGRYVRSKTATAALEQGFDSYCETGKFPFCVLFINVHPTFVDVNVHPTKLEVKFSNERTLFDAVYCAVRNTLSDPATTGGTLLEPARVTPSERGLYNAFVPIEDRLENTPTKNVSAEKLLDEPSISDLLPKNTEKAVDRKEEPPKEVPTAEKPNTAPVSKTPTDKPQPVDPFSAEKKAEDFDKKEEAPKETAKDKAVDSLSFLASLTGITYGETNAPTEEATALPLDPTPKIDPTTPTDPTPPSVGSEQAIFDALKNADLPPNEVEVEEKTKETPAYRIIGVAFHAYIMVEVDDVTLINDKHAAHERILFERMKKNRETSRKGLGNQMLLIPLEITLSAEERGAATDFAEELGATGFDFTLSDSGAILTGVPVGLSVEESSEMFTVLCEQLSTGAGNVAVTEKMFYEKALYQASCKAAMKAGIIDTPENIKWLVETVLENPDIRYCPHGRPIAFELSRRDMEKFFKRT